MTLQLYYSVPILSPVNFVTAIWFILCNWTARGKEKKKKERARGRGGGGKGRRPPRGLTLNREKNSRERRIYFANVFVDISVLANHFSEGKKCWLLPFLHRDHARYDCNLVTEGERGGEKKKKKKLTGKLLPPRSECLIVHFWSVQTMNKAVN